MDKLVLLLISGFLATNAIAEQPTFFGSTPKTQSTAAPTASASRPVLSPTEFNSKISEISAKNDAAFKQHLNQQLSQVPPPVVPKVPVPKSTEPSTSAPSSHGSATGTIFPSTSDEVEEMTTSKTPTPTPTTKISSPTVQPNPESYSTTPPPSTTGGNDNNTFTGFGTGSSGTRAPSKSQGSTGSGWSIKY